jgi:hypothetical protein
MSNRNRNQNTNINQTIENLLLNYLLNYTDLSTDGANSDFSTNATNPMTDRIVSSLLRVFDSYQRNVEIYHRNMGELIHLLRTNMNTSSQPVQIATAQTTPEQTTGRRENRYRPWYFTSTTTQSTTDPSNNAIPPPSTRTPTYNSTTATTASSPNNAIPPPSTRTPTYNSTTATTASSPNNAIPPVSTRTPTYNSTTATSSNHAIPPRSIRAPTYSSTTASSTSTLPANNLLTHREIVNNVSTIEYSSDETETRCPISFEDFCVGERICKINTCGHIFKREPLYQWLNNHNTCPVCRANVLSTTSNTQANIINEYSQYIAYTLLAGLNTNPSNIQTYTFDLPIYYDTSGNTGSSNISNNYDYIVEEEDDDED